MMLSTERRKHYAWGALWALIVALLLLALYSVITTRQLTGTVRSCVEPGGRCYQIAREQRLETVHLINHFTVAAAECARQPNLPTREVKQCVMRKIDKEQP